MKATRRQLLPAWIVVGGLATVVGAGVVAMRVSIRPPNVTNSADTPPLPVAAVQDGSGVTTQPPVELPPIRSGVYMNTTSAARYVGSDACKDCHPAQFDSYRQTPHSQALGEIDVAQEPPDGDFFHAPSRRRFASRRHANSFVHTEQLVDAHGEVLAEAAHTVGMVIGSGHHSRSYLVEQDGFWYESPITWYASKQSWWMSPGYDRPVHDSFERPVDVGCVHCHAGNVEVVDGNRYRIRIYEKAIGCENCHGPGSLHVEHRLNNSNNSEQDFTIVNPARLERTLSEHICAKCHLRGAASVLVRGRDMEDYRPGLFLTDFRVNYVAEGHQQMTVVGHVEQMRQSACWQKSNTLTCITCHDPHRPLLPTEKIGYFRAKCIECHQPAQCGLPQEMRQERTPSDSCVECHMPQSPTDIPHFAFTHHRIGIHVAEANEPNSLTSSSTAVQLLPIDDISHLPDWERKRCLGLAYMEFADKTDSPDAQLVYHQRAVELLQDVLRSGIDDADAWAALARIAWQHADIERAMDAAMRAVRKNTPSGARVNSLIIIADLLESQGHYEETEKVVRELLRIRRHSSDYLLLAICQIRGGKTQEAIKSLEVSLTINPFRAMTRELLVKLLEQTGQASAAAVHRRVLEHLPK